MGNRNLLPKVRRSASANSSVFHHAAHRWDSARCGALPARFSQRSLYTVSPFPTFMIHRRRKTERKSLSKNMLCYGDNLDLLRRTGTLTDFHPLSWGAS